MKKEVEVVKPARRIAAQVVKKEKFYCDLCGSLIDKSRDYHYGSGGSYCCMCGRDICRKQSCMRRENLEDYGSDNYCAICHKLRFEKYDRAFMVLKTDYEIAEENLEHDIVDESLTYKQVADVVIGDV